MQIIVFTTVAGTTSGFITSWLYAGAMLFAPPALLTLFAGRSVYQQVTNIKEALAFKKLVNEILKPVDKDLNIFFQNSSEQRSKTKSNRIVKISSNILRIGKRSSSNFFRVYLKPNGRDVRFELELKKTIIKKFQHYLFTNQFERFEELLVCHFYHQTI